MNYYITKYALTRGIVIEDCDDVGLGYVRPVKAELATCQYKLNRDAFVTYKEAVIKAEKMRFDKIAALKKQLYRLENLMFKE